ncbi:MAG: glycosyltransferase [Candidatus Omnitrophota bacterium]|jgi:dolichol-phosphate mannosyltransferase
MKLSVIIPAHNEEDHIYPVVNELRTELVKAGIEFEIVVVDDNSKDNTGTITDRLTKEHKDVKFVRRVGGNGFGKAIKDGLASASGDCAIIVMADKSDCPEDVVKIFRKLEEGYDVVYGNRFIRGSEIHNYPPLKFIINRMANYFIMSLFWINENDITNAFKGYKMEVIKQLWPLESDHFNITAELPLKAYMRGFTKISVPVKWYGRESGVSKLSILKMGNKYLMTVLKIRLAGKKPPAEDIHWEDYWHSKEDNTFLGKALFKLREKFWVNIFTEFAITFGSKGKVLEAGSGSALSSIFLAKRRGDDITALDISSGALIKARQCADKYGTKIKLVRGDLYRLPFQDKAFDMVWNSGTMEHFTDPAPIFKEMRRVGNEIICIVPAKGIAFYMLGMISSLFGRNFKRYFLREDELFYSIESLSDSLRKAGFKDMRVKKIFCIGIFPYIAAYCKS